MFRLFISVAVGFIALVASTVLAAFACTTLADVVIIVAILAIAVPIARVIGATGPIPIVTIIATEITGRPELVGQKRDHSFRNAGAHIKAVPPPALAPVFLRHCPLSQHVYLRWDLAQPEK